MTKLEELIKELCPNGVGRVILEKCCEILDNKRKPVTRSARTFGKYPYYGANGIQDYVNDYIFDGEFVLVGEDGSVIDDNGRPIVTWATGKIWVNNHAHIIQAKEGVLLRYLYHYLQTIDITSLVHGNIPKLTGKDFRELQIPLPPLAAQCEIVCILDNFTELTAELTAEFTAELTAELTARRKQYEYYKNKLLSFDESNKLLYKVKYLKLYEICLRQKGIPITAGEMKKIDKIDAPIRLFAAGNTIANVNYGDIPQECVITKPSIIVKSRGNIGFEYYDKPFNHKNELWSYSIKSTDVNLKYIYYYLQAHSTEFQLKAKTGKLPQISTGDTDDYRLPVPPLEVQEKIVETLDKFDKLCNDLSEGLPAEIEKRQKQYEYYRDKILTFEEVTL